MISGRLIVDRPGPGEWNMAVDQALLEDVDAGGPPTLRFYAWDQPTLSLGYFQSIEHRSRHSESESLPLVRRATGGGAILHDAELTYSLCMPITDRASQRVRAIYDAVHRSIIAALSESGVATARYADSAKPAGQPASPSSPAPQREEEPFLCFQRRTDEDLILTGYKIAGSAQRRAARAVLQHGSVLLAASRWAPQLPGIFELTTQRIAYDVLATRIAHHAGFQVGVRWSDAQVPAAIRERAGEVVDARFAHQSWTARR